MSVGNCTDGKLLVPYAELRADPELTTTVGGVDMRERASGERHDPERRLRRRRHGGINRRGRGIGTAEPQARLPGFARLAIELPGTGLGRTCTVTI